MRTIDMASWPRRKHFDFFHAFDYPHFNLCANVDVTALYAWVKAHGHSFNVTVAYLLAQSANTVPELRQRIREGQVVEHDLVHPSFVVLAENELFSFCTVPYDADFAAFAAHAAEIVARVRREPTVEDEPGRDDMLYMTSIPWVSFTSIMHPIHMRPVTSIPSIAWGKFVAGDDRHTMPLSLQAHHALVDGLHAGRFYEAAQARFDAPEDFLGGCR